MAENATPSKSQSMKGTEIFLLITTVVFAGTTAYFGYDDYKVRQNFKKVLAANPNATIPTGITVPK